MATINSLKQVLRDSVSETASSLKQPLSDAQYDAGFNILMTGLGWDTYRGFIIPQISQRLAPLFNAHHNISVLEIGPGPRSVLGYLPDRQRRKITKYTALEPNVLFATRLEEWLCPTSRTDSPFPYLENSPDIQRIPFLLHENMRTGTNYDDEKYDVILFCHSMHGMKPKHKFIEQALEMLAEQPRGGMVVVFHRDANLNFDGLVCHQRLSFPNGLVSVVDQDETLDSFASFFAGCTLQDMDEDRALRVKWRKVCRKLGRREESHPDRLVFSSPDAMVVFTQSATMLPELTAQVPLSKRQKTVKNREARLQIPAAIVRPTEIKHVQQCVRWALKHQVGLTVVGGGHSGHCLVSNVVSVDMGAFNQVHILPAEEDGSKSALVVVETGCTTEDIIRKTIKAGLTVPLGARPSVGAGLWLQGGIGHLARLHGLTCDAIVGAMVVSVESAKVLCIGYVPSQHCPIDATRPENEVDYLWALKGAGTNFGIVVSITFNAFVAPTYSIGNWIVPLSNNNDASRKLGDFNELARRLPSKSSADAYLYYENGQLHLGVTLFEVSSSQLPHVKGTPIPFSAKFGSAVNSEIVDSLGMFDTEMYMSGMHGGHAGGKTSSFKRCLFLNDISSENIAGRLVAAVQTRPSPLCYLHLLQGGRAVGEVADNATAFGYRDWEFACVITGVWPRDQDGEEAARAAVSWVYRVVEDLLPVCRGVYSADLGPDPRDATLAAMAFGPNRPRLGQLNRSLDPSNILRHACPLPKTPKLIIIVTGDICAGKDFVAEGCASRISRQDIRTRVVSISDLTKREYAKAKGADLKRLLSDRAYKEHHRPALTAFFQEQMRERPCLPQEHFMNVVCSATDVDVLFITGMRDEAPVATFSHLVPDSRLLEIRVMAKKDTRDARGGDSYTGEDRRSGSAFTDSKNKDNNTDDSNLSALDYRPSLVFANDMTGNEASERFAEQDLLPFLHQDLQRLAEMVRAVPDFPRPGSDFRHIHKICQKPGGLNLCTSLLQSHFTGDWAKVDAVVCSEAGGFLYASPLAVRLDVPLILVRKSGMLPPPTISVPKSSSYMSSLISDGSKEERIEMEKDVVRRGSSVVIVDDVLSTGKTLRAMIELLVIAGIRVEDISVIVVAEFPVHRGRELLRQSGFGMVSVQSLLIFGVS